MSKRGAGERDYAPSQGNMRKARVEVRRVDAIQVLMASARARSVQAQQQPDQQAGPAPSAASAPPPPPVPALAPQAPHPALAPGFGPSAPSAPCAHCGTVLPVYAGSCSLRQCCGCLDVFCSLCSVLDYEERDDRPGSSRGGARSGPATPSRGGATGRGGPAAAGLCLSLSVPISGAAGRWGQLEALGLGARSSPFCAGTPQQRSQQQQGGEGGGAGAGSMGAGGRTPGSGLLYSSRSHRGFSSLLAYGGGGA
ncbi:hypothetical protein TSOC_013818 [Tetrabaena socialis]|uniref:Uncharacterized protein n=1 Tax=Tetrabaena socialis TaxID=47790 RepID=A0A2J7ZJC2_9CHLO|nr:hypothetical protein TSOC_013818 [Tetrabaena socialis]|eukprot:PNH00364.1 hypothetical protein TSOC_013818 [Tetrabaena socialis]